MLGIGNTMRKIAYLVLGWSLEGTGLNDFWEIWEGLSSRSLEGIHSLIHGKTNRFLFLFIIHTTFAFSSDECIISQHFLL